MNHDYAHCLDYSSKCPPACFRAEITKEIVEAPWECTLSVSWMHFAGTDECKKRSMNDSELGCQSKKGVILAHGK